MKIDLDEVVLFVMQADGEYGMALANGLNRLRDELAKERRQRDELLSAVKDARHTLIDWKEYIPSNTIQEDIDMLGIAIANAEKQS